MENGYYKANAFNLGDILISLDKYETRETVVFYPKIFRYRKIVANDIVFYINEYGSGLSLQAIPGATTLEEAKTIYNSNEFYYPAYNELVHTINATFHSTIRETDISFIVEITAQKRVSEYAQISIQRNQHFDNYFSIFIESIFILQLCRLLERKLTSLLSQRKSYYSQKVLTELAGNLFIVDDPQGYLPNHNEFEYLKELYVAWNIDRQISTLKSKYDLSLTNYKFFLEYNEKRQNIITTLLLASITIFSINQTIPILYDSYPVFDKNTTLLFFTAFAVLMVIYTLIRYYIYETITKMVFKFRNRRLRKRLSK